MFKALRDLFRHDVESLEGIVKEGPVVASLRAEIASENNATSPITGQRAAFFHWDFLAERTASLAAELHGIRRVRVALGSGWKGGDLLLVAGETRVLLPAQRYTVEFLNAGRPSEVLSVTMPPEFSHIAASPAALGEIFYNELALLKGEKVRVRATFERLASSTAEGANFKVRPDLGPIVIEQDLREISDSA